MLGDEIAIYLAGASLGLTVGSTASGGVFAVPFPPEAGNTASCVIEYPGRDAIEAMGASLSASLFERPRFQVVCRDLPENALACRTLARNIWLVLRRFSGTLTSSTGGSVIYGRIKALQSPFFLKFDDNQRTYYACNFEAYKQES